jgi:hypothetical protein
MITVLIVVAVVMVLALVALKMGLDRKEMPGTDESRGPVIHRSGIYSIVRDSSPREDLEKLRPTEEQIRGYLAGVDADSLGTLLKASSRDALVRHWKAQTDANLLAIEAGDKNGAAFYYYDFPVPCPICSDFVTKGNFVTREEIYRNPHIIPPFHLGCTCILTAMQGDGEGKSLRDTVVIGMLPFFKSGEPPPLPEWKCTISMPEVRSKNA